MTEFVLAWLMTVTACGEGGCHTVYRRFPSKHACEVRSDHIIMAVEVTDPPAWGFAPGGKPVQVTVKCAPVRGSDATT